MINHAPTNWMLMKNSIIYIFVFLSFVLFSRVCFATILVVDDFDSGVFYNNVGGTAGVSNDGNPGEFCNGKIVSEEKTGTSGFSMQLSYRVDTSQNIGAESNDKFIGYWSKLNSLDVCDYSYLTLYVKGDVKTGYTANFWIELKNADVASRIQLKEITQDWQKFKIPLEEFPDLQDKTKLTELRIIFDQTVSVDEGVVYIDNIAFEQ